MAADTQRKGRKPTDGVVFLCSPLLYYAGQQLHGKTSTQTLRYYVSRSRPRFSCHAQNIDNAVITLLKGVKFPPIVVSHVEKMLIEKYGATAKGDAQRRRNEAIETITNLVRMQATNKIRQPEEIYERLLTEATKQRNDANAILATQTDTEKLMVQLTDLGNVISAMQPAHQKNAIYNLFERIDINSEGKIASLTPREWARTAFAELRRAIGTNMIPTGFEPVFKP